MNLAIFPQSAIRADVHEQNSRHPGKATMSLAVFPQSAIRSDAREQSPWHPGKVTAQ